MEIKEATAYINPVSSEWVVRLVCTSDGKKSEMFYECLNEKSAKILEEILTNRC